MVLVVDFKTVKAAKSKSKFFPYSKTNEQLFTFNVPLTKDYYIDGTLSGLFLKKCPLGEGKRPLPPPQRTPRGCIFWTMIYYII